ncbi:alpha/beta fold hydrolase [Streptomyces sp. NPDC088794]|uniref:alpha/beta fold hydrolase n=1 Tax=Streptomyces sp. NPDC088794 TaxID=3365902 RepID=UPI0037F61B7C
MTSENISQAYSVYPDLPLTVTETGPADGRPVLVLHGGGGPFTVAGIAQHLAANGARVLTPVHPGWDSNPRPDWLTGIDDLALAYLHLLQDLDLKDVLVIGSSMGGWIAAEMAVRDVEQERVSGVVLINSAGVYVDSEPIADFFALDPRAAAELTWHDPDRFYVDPATVPAEQLAARQANMATMRVLAGEPNMHDPKLLRRLGRVRQPALVVWGESDGLFTAAYGAAYASAFGDGRFELVPKAGHLPQLEQPEVTFRLIDEHLDRTA